MATEETPWESTFQKCIDFHGHVCPGLAMGYRAARGGLDWLKENRADDEEIVAIVETDSCFADAVQVLTGCTFGKGNFIHRDHGKTALTLFSRATNHGVRLLGNLGARQPDPNHRALMDKIRGGTATPDERARFHELHLARARDVLTMPLEDLFDIQEVRLPAPEKARIEPTLPCERCGEGTQSSKLEKVQGASLCRACAGPVGDGGGKG